MPRNKLKPEDINRIKRYCVTHGTRITVSEILKELTSMYPQWYPELIPGTRKYKLNEVDNYKSVIRKLLRKWELSHFLKRETEKVYDTIGVLQRERTRYIWHLPDKTPDILVAIPHDEFKFMIRTICDPESELDSIILEANRKILLGNKDIRYWKKTLTEELRLVLMNKDIQESEWSTMFGEAFEETLKRSLERLDIVFQELKELQ